MMDTAGARFDTRLFLGPYKALLGADDVEEHLRCKPIVRAPRGGGTSFLYLGSAREHKST